VVPAAAATGAGASTERTGQSRIGQLVAGSETILTRSPHMIRLPLGIGQRCGRPMALRDCTSPRAGRTDLCRPLPCQRCSPRESPTITCSLPAAGREHLLPPADSRRHAAGCHAPAATTLRVTSASDPTSERPAPRAAGAATSGPTLVPYALDAAWRLSRLPHTRHELSVSHRRLVSRHPSSFPERNGLRLARIKGLRPIGAPAGRSELEIKQWLLRFAAAK
jgi:hypothetical protein